MNTPSSSRNHLIQSSPLSMKGRNTIHSSTTQWNATPLQEEMSLVSNLNLKTRDGGLPRRCKSDSNLFRPLSSKCSFGSSRITSTSLFQRSGAAGVKDLIQNITTACSEREQQIDDTAKMPPPEEECRLLAKWAEDDYYQVVITKYKGVSAIVRAMRCFPEQEIFQATCCLALGNLCNTNYSDKSKVIIPTDEVISTIVSIMKRYPTSLVVQRESCQALYVMRCNVATYFRLTIPKSCH